MRALNYTRLMSTSNSTSPYRGNVNRFPLFSRKENTKYFLVGKKDGKTIFNIVHGGKYERKDITKEEYDAYSTVGKLAHKDKDNTYYIYDTVPNVIGRVYPDNSFEFINSYYGQGERQILANCVKGWFTSDSRRGGLIYFEDGGFMLPIYKGMRVNCETMKPLQPLAVIGKSVNRKASKALMAGYKDFFTVSETMSKVMDLETFLDTAKSIHTEYKAINNSNIFAGGELVLIADSILHEKPLDAMFLYMISFNSGRMGFFIDNGGQWGRPQSVAVVYEAMRKRLSKRLYESNKSIFNTITYEGGTRIPASDWGYELQVNGKQVNQCGG